MKLFDNYRCPKCGDVKPVTEVLLPPKDGKPAEEQPCTNCGPVVWVPVKR